MAGEFCWSLTATDVHTQWTETRAVSNRGQYEVAKRIAEIEAALPFAILGFDTDNGGEFLNWHLLHYFTRRRHPVGFTRSRAYRKNDNARVEQKNWTHVRQLVGYARLEDPRAAELLNELYAKEWGWFRNFFCPVMKHLRTDVEGSRKRRIYDAPATPFERLKACAAPAKRRSQPSKISIALWILSRSKKPSRSSCAPCCVTKFGGPFSKRPDSPRIRLVHKPVALAGPQRPSSFPSGLGLPLPRLPAFVNKPTPVSFSLKQRIAIYFNPRCLFSLRQHG